MAGSCCFDGTTNGLSPLRVETLLAALYGLLLHLPGAGLGALVGSGFAHQEVFEAPGTGSRRLPSLSVVPVRGGATGSLGWAF
jgi:hypothetical protein